MGRSSNVKPLVDRDGQGEQKEGVECDEPRAEDPGRNEVQQDEKEEEDACRLGDLLAMCRLPGFLVPRSSQGCLTFLLVAKDLPRIVVLLGAKGVVKGPLLGIRQD